MSMIQSPNVVHHSRCLHQLSRRYLSGVWKHSSSFSSLSSTNGGNDKIINLFRQRRHAEVVKQILGRNLQKTNSTTTNSNQLNPPNPSRKLLRGQNSPNKNPSQKDLVDIDKQNDELLNALLKKSRRKRGVETKAETSVIGTVVAQSERFGESDPTGITNPKSLVEWLLFCRSCFAAEEYTFCSAISDLLVVSFGGNDGRRSINPKIVSSKLVSEIEIVVETTGDIHSSVSLEFDILATVANVVDVLRGSKDNVEMEQIRRLKSRFDDLIRQSIHLSMHQPLVCAYAWRGLCNYRVEDYETAKRDFHSALRIDIKAAFSLGGSAPHFDFLNGRSTVLDLYRELLEKSSDDMDPPPIALPTSLMSSTSKKVPVVVGTSVNRIRLAKQKQDEGEPDTSLAPMKSDTTSLVPFELVVKSKYPRREQKQKPRRNSIDLRQLSCPAWIRRQWKT